MVTSPDRHDYKLCTAGSQFKHDQTKKLCVAENKIGLFYLFGEVVRYGVKGYEPFRDRTPSFWLEIRQLERNCPVSFAGLSHPTVLFASK